MNEQPYTFYNVHTQPFSNFYPSPFKINNLIYPTAEHYYQSKKFEATQQEQKIRKAPTVQQAHFLGQQYHPQFDYEEWCQKRFQVYEVAVISKFTQNKELAEKLRKTGSKPIVCIDEDRFWGMKYDDSLNKLVGQNQAGEILMKVRGKLLNEAAVEQQQ